MDNTAMEKVINELDEDIRQKDPKGILVHSDLFAELKMKGRITIENLILRICPHITFTHYMLDKKVFVTPDDMSCIGKPYRLPQSNVIDELPR